MTIYNTSYMLSEVPEGEKPSELPDFPALYSHHYGPLYYWILGLTHNKAVAEDVCSMAFTYAFEHFGELRDKTLFKEWLYQAAYHIFCRYWRKAKRQVSLTDDHNEISDPTDFVDDLSRYYEVQRVHAALKLMDDTRRRVLLRWCEGKPCQGTLGSRLNKAKKELVKRILRDGHSLPSLNKA